MTWQVLVGVSVLTQASSILLQRVLMKDHKSDPVAYAIIFQLLVALVIFIFTLFRGIKIPNIMPLLPNLLLVAILYAAANIFIFSSLKKIEASRFTILFQSRVIWTIIIAILFLGENFSWMQGLGTLLITLSVIIVTGSFSKFRLGRGELFALLGALTFGVGIANDAFIIRSFDAISYTVFAFLLPAILTCLVYPKSVKKMGFILDKKIFFKMLLLAVLYGIAAAAVYLAYQVGRNIAIIAPLTQLSTIVAVALAILLLKEKSNLLKKSFGAIISFIGALLLK